MNVKVTRKQLAELLRLPDTNNIRQAIKRGSIVERDGLIDLSDPANRSWLNRQKINARRKGYIIDLSFGPDDNNNDNPVDVDTELKKARIDLVKEQTKTAQLNREISFGHYLKTSAVIDAVKIYLDQTMNVANTNLSNVASRFCREHGIKETSEIIKLKTALTDTLNLAIESGRKEVMNSIQRLIDDQVEKLATK